MTPTMTNTSFWIESNVIFALASASETPTPYSAWTISNGCPPGTTDGVKGNFGGDTLWLCACACCAGASNPVLLMPALLPADFVVAGEAWALLKGLRSEVYS